MRPESSEQYVQALKRGQKYYKAALSRGEYPYLPALDEILRAADVAGQDELGLVDIPTELITGTRTAGRTNALAGNFMPLLPAASEFAVKWMLLCDAHLGDEGIRDPIRCYEYMGRFYVQEGNKRVSVLMSYDAPTIPGVVVRVVPRYSDDHSVQLYYEFMHFYSLSRIYGVEFRHRGGYARLQAALGVEADHVWTEEQRRSFIAGFTRFREAFRALSPSAPEITPAEALLVWLQVYPFSDLKTLAIAELGKKLSGLWPDIVSLPAEDAIEVHTAPTEKTKPLLSRIIGAVRPEHMNIAFIYAFPPSDSPWTQAHDGGRRYLAEHMGERVTVRVYTSEGGDHFAAIERAAEEGAELIFATTASMIGACRRAAALHPNIKLLNCGLSQPYTGVRMYYPRIHECKFITGAIAGAMAQSDMIGYIAGYPIFGTTASVNAFALGVRMTNPRARVLLAWSCCEPDAAQRLLDRGVTVISNRDAVTTGHSLELGTYRYLPDGTVEPLAAPLLYWGEMYERIVLSVFSGAWADISKSRAINYWWGMDSGVLDISLGLTLSDGQRELAQILKSGIRDGALDPFRTRITDQTGTLRNDGAHGFTPEQLMHLDWFCDNVDGAIPPYEDILPMSRETVRLLGLYRMSLPPETVQTQL